MSERKKDVLWRILVAGGLFCWALFMMLTLIGCGDGSSSNITGPSVNPNAIVLDSSKDEDLKLVKMYNSDRTGGKATRWNKSIVTIYDSTGKVANLQSILNDWNSASGGKLTLAVGGPGSDIEISGNNSSCGEGGATPYNGFLYIGFIRLNQSCLNDGYLDYTIKHEIGHAIGFFNHNSDGGIMSSIGGIGGNSQITNEVSRMIQKLYSLDPGTVII